MKTPYRVSQKGENNTTQGVKENIFSYCVEINSLCVYDEITWSYDSNNFTSRFRQNSSITVDMVPEVLLKEPYNMLEDVYLCG